MAARGSSFCLDPGATLTPLRWGQAGEALPRGGSFVHLRPLTRHAEAHMPFLPAIPLTAYGPMAAAAAAAAVVRGTGEAFRGTGSEGGGAGGQEV